MDSTRPRNIREGKLAPPKRPLSAFNLYYRFKRQKILDAVAINHEVDKESIKGLVFSPAGLENHPTHGTEDISPGMLGALRRKNISKELENNLEPRDTKARSHHKAQGTMYGGLSFVELGKLMSNSWVHCDDFAKNVFEELAEEGRDRYRRRLRAFKPSSQGIEIAKAAKGMKSTKKKLPPKSPKTKSSFKTSSEGTEAAKPTKKRKSTKDKLLPQKIKTQALPHPSLDGNVSEDEKAENETAEVMIQLAKYIPLNGYKKRSLPPTKERYSGAPTLLDLLSQREPPNDEAGIETMTPARDGMRTISTAYGSSQIFLPPKPLPMQPNPKYAAQAVSEQTLSLRVRELEVQLAKERLRARIRELEDDMSKHKAKEMLIRSVIDNATSQSWATATTATAQATSTLTALTTSPVAAMTPNVSNCPRSFAQDGLWSLVSATMIHPRVQAFERAATFSRMVHPYHCDASTPSVKRPSSTVSPSNSPGGIKKECSTKKQRLN